MTEKPTPPDLTQATAPSGPISVRRLAVQLLVISAGVLTALMADASWNWLQERAEEREALAQLRSDFEFNLAELDIARGYHEAALDASYDLLAITLGMGSRTSTKTDAMLVNDMITAWTFNPDLGGLSSLIASGKLGIIRDDDLRISLAGWPDLVDDLGENERQEWHYCFDVLEPVLVAAGVNVNVSRDAGLLRRIPATGLPSDMSPLLDDASFVQMIGSRISNLHVLLDEMENVRHSTEEILRNLQAR